MYNFILPSAARVAGAGVASPTVVIPVDASIRAELDVTASTAPTTLDAKVQHTSDNGANWFDLAAFTQIGAVATGRQSIHIPTPHSGVIRVLTTQVGTSYTYSVTLRAEPLT